MPTVVRLRSIRGCLDSASQATGRCASRRHAALIRELGRLRATDTPEMVDARLERLEMAVPQGPLGAARWSCYAVGSRGATGLGQPL